jgi:hypothetical protein
MSSDSLTPAHSQTHATSYTEHYPAHPARKDDPHYVDFNHFHKKFGPTARCQFAVQADFEGDPEPVRQADVPHRMIGAGEARVGCDVTKPMELHHAHIEFATMNNVDLALMEDAYPGISDPEHLGAWVESFLNFEWLCVFHHRGHGGAHVASASDWEAQHFMKGFLS